MTQPIELINFVQKGTVMRPHEMVNEHQTRRVMLTLNIDEEFDRPTEFKLQTLKDNVRLLGSEMLEGIN